MIELEKHITKLLLSNDCVIIPDFGGFVAHHVDAFYDAEDNLFYPPLRTVGFNQQLKMNDSMLIQSFVEEYDMSYPEAQTRIGKQVEEMKEQLDNEGRFEMHDLGVLRLGSEGNYDFEPCEAGILTPSLYGLSTYKFATVTRNSAVKVEPKQVEEIKKVETVVEEPLVEDKEELEDKDYIRISYKALRYFAAACLLFAAFMLFPSKMGENGSFSILKSKIDTGAIFNIIPKDAMMSTTETLVSATKNDSNAEKKVVETPKKEEIKEVEVKKEVEDYYTVVLASKVSHKNANAFVERLHKDGYAEAKVLSTGKYAKVVYKEFKTEAEAYSELNKVNDNEKFSDAWVTKIKAQS